MFARIPLPLLCAVLAASSNGCTYAVREAMWGGTSGDPGTYWRTLEQAKQDGDDELRVDLEHIGGGFNIEDSERIWDLEQCYVSYSLSGAASRVKRPHDVKSCAEACRLFVHKAPTRNEASLPNDIELAEKLARRCEAALPDAMIAMHLPALNERLSAIEDQAKKRQYLFLFQNLDGFMADIERQRAEGVPAVALDELATKAQRVAEANAEGGALVQRYREDETTRRLEALIAGLRDDQRLIDFAQQRASQVRDDTATRRTYAATGGLTAVHEGDPQAHEQAVAAGQALGRTADQAWSSLAEVNEALANHQRAMGVMP